MLLLGGGGAPPPAHCLVALALQWHWGLASLLGVPGPRARWHQEPWRWLRALRARMLQLLLRWQPLASPRACVAAGARPPWVSRPEVTGCLRWSFLSGDWRGPRPTGPEARGFVVASVLPRVGLPAHTISCLSKRRESSFVIGFLDQNPSLDRSHLDQTKLNRVIFYFHSTSKQIATNPQMKCTLASATPKEDLRLSRRRAALS